MNLDNAQADVDTAMTKFTEAATALARAGGEAAAVKAVETRIKKDEEHLKRLVGHLSTQRFGGDWREAWIRIYERLEVLTGYHPAAYTPDAKTSHLEQCRRDGKVKQVLTAARSLFLVHG